MIPLDSTNNSVLPHPSLANFDIPQDQLNISNKERCNLFPWKGQFSPQLVEILLQTYGFDGCFVLDPFMGSGTVLHEAGILGFEAFGVEINPAACKIAQIYKFINVSKEERLKVLTSINAKLLKSIPSDLPLFKNNTNSGDDDLDIFDKLLNLYNSASDKNEKSLLETIITLCDKKKDEKTDPKKLLNKWLQISNKVKNLPFSENSIDFANCDSRKIPIEEQTVDLVITSPPYINVFNYHQQYRHSMETMGWNILEMAKSEIGSNRKHRGNRFLTVIQYILDMIDVFHSLRRVSKDNTLVIFVVGRESNIRKTSFYNSHIVERLATEVCKFSLVKQQERVFQNRYGADIYEDILYFRPMINGCELEKTNVSGLDIAQDILEEARCRTPSESLDDLDNALLKLTSVKKSPFYKEE